MLSQVLRTAPIRYIAQSGAIKHFLPCYLKDVHVLVVAGRTAWERAGDVVHQALSAGNCSFHLIHAGRQCYWQLAEELADQAKDLDASWVVGVGGGKIMDLAKLIGEIAILPVALIPTTPSTCACWTSLSVVYDSEGKNPASSELQHSPDLTLVDFEILASAPARHLAAGILDALAKWYEISSLVDTGDRHHPSIWTALNSAKLCRDLLFEYGPKAVSELGQGQMTETVEQAIWVSMALPGIASGMVTDRYKFSIAHAFYNHLTRIENARKASLHGEQVALGIVVQMLLMNPVHSEINDFLRLCMEMNAPMTLNGLGLHEDDYPLLDEVISGILSEPGIANLPFSTSKASLWAAVQEADRRGRISRQNAHI